MSVKGGVYAHEAYEAKKIKIFFLLRECMGPTSFLYIYILLSLSSRSLSSRSLSSRSLSLAPSLSLSRARTHALWPCVSFCLSLCLLVYVQMDVRIFGSLLKLYASILCLRLCFHLSMLDCACAYVFLKYMYVHMHMCVCVCVCVCVYILLRLRICFL